ncbi:MAG: DNA repair protein RadA [Actinomycetota bacterium]|nr:DNA repair protein RadA [Actinomycetota bacterium]
MADYRCTTCSYRTSRWMGFCPQCRGSGTLLEEEADDRRVDAPTPVAGIVTDRVERLRTGVDEFDRVMGGGVVPGSVALLGGAPGVGKSTLVLGVGSALASTGVSVLVATGEESRPQVGLRAQRIGSVSDGLLITTESDVGHLSHLIRSGDYPLVVIDSIQTVTGVARESATGTMSAIRDSAAGLIASAKHADVAVLLIGHITKDGTIAGPKSLEHMVDVVLSLDGDPHRNLRFLRSVKNRFGSVNEVGVFEMTDRGLDPMSDPSAVLSGDRDGTSAGSVLFPALDGRRSLIVEIQALTVPTKSAQPRRSVKGLPTSRVHQVLAALERHGGFKMSGLDVYVSVMGGLSITEPAADLPTALAIASAVAGVPLGSTAAWGEVGLTGEVRRVEQADRRRAESRRLGIKRIVEAAGQQRVDGTLGKLGLRPPGDGSRSALHVIPNEDRAAP